MKETRTLRELFSFPGFYAQRQLKGIFGDPKARIGELKRQKKERYAQDVARATVAITMPKPVKPGISMRWDGAFIFAMSNVE